MTRIALIVIFLLLLASSQTQNLQLGLLISLKSHEAETDLLKFIDYYARQNCSFISEINVVWYPSSANQTSPIQPLKQKWSSQMRLHELRNNEDELQFRVNKSSSADFYYRCYADMRLSCEQLQVKWQGVKGQVKAKLAPLIGEKMSATVSNIVKKEFNYSSSPTAKHYQFVQNITFIPAHFIHLAHANIRELNLINNHLLTPCEEIYLNFVAAHFYPELKPVFQKPTFQSQFSQAQKFGNQKSQCIKAIIDELGYHPLYYQKKSWGKTIWKNSAEALIISLKKSELEMHMQKNNSRLLTGKDEDDFHKQILEQREQSKQLVEVIFFECSIWAMGVVGLIGLNVWISRAIKRAK